MQTAPHPSQELILSVQESAFRDIKEVGCLIPTLSLPNHFSIKYQPPPTLYLDLNFYQPTDLSSSSYFNSDMTKGGSSYGNKCACKRDKEIEAARGYPDEDIKPNLVSNSQTNRSQTTSTRIPIVSWKNSKFI